MVKEVLINRYNAYYQGWCLAFGEHEATYDESKDICWLIGEGRIGLAIAPKLRRQLYKIFLGSHEKTPELILENEAVKAGSIVCQLTDDSDKDSMILLQEFVDGKDKLHLFLTNHFCYPSGTRIITFDKNKPSILLYKEMQPMKVLIK